MKSVIPKYHGKKVWNDEIFLELEDLLNGFGTSPAIMDIKMGSRTFMESEVSNNKARTDLYQKVLKQADRETQTYAYLDLKSKSSISYFPILIVVIDNFE